MATFTMKKSRTNMKVAAMRTASAGAFDLVMPGSLPPRGHRRDYLGGRRQRLLRTAGPVRRRVALSDVQAARLVAHAEALRRDLPYELLGVGRIVLLERRRRLAARPGAPRRPSPRSAMSVAARDRPKLRQPTARTAAAVGLSAGKNDSID